MDVLARCGRRIAELRGLRVCGIAALLVGSLIAAPTAGSPHGAADGWGPDGADAGARALGTTTPARYVDTRSPNSTFDGLFAGEGRLGAGTSYEVVIAGRGEVPLLAAGAIVELTAVGPSAPGFLTAHACGVTRPTASALNYTTGVDVANEVFVGLSGTGSLCVSTSAEVDLLIDVVGHVMPDDGVRLLTPARLADSRPGASTVDGASAGFGRTAPGSETRVRVAGRGSVPRDAGTAIVNVAAVDPVDDGFVAVDACLPGPPTASSLNHTAGVNRANELVVEVDAKGEICLYTDRSIHLIVDVVGYVAAGSNLTTVDPARLVETRAGAPTVDGQHQGGGPLAAGSSMAVQIAGRAEVPADASAAIVNVAAVDPVRDGFLTVDGCTDPRPDTSTLNFTRLVNGANEIVVRLDPTGRLCLYTSATTDVLIDAVGYVLPTAQLGSIRGLKFDDVDGDGLRNDAVVITEILDATGDGAGNILRDPYEIATDLAGNAYVTGFTTDNVFKVTPSGAITEILDATGDGAGNGLDGPWGVATDPLGNVYVAGNSSHNVFRVSPSGDVSLLLDGSGDGMGNRLAGPWGIATDAFGNVYVTGFDSDNAFRVTRGGAVTEIIDASGDGVGRPLEGAYGVGTDRAGNVYVTGFHSRNVFVVASDGSVTEFLDIGDFPLGVATNRAGDVYLTRSAWNGYVVKVTPAGVVTTVLDQNGDGAGNTLSWPQQVASDSMGSVYVTGAASHNAFEVAADGAITEVLDENGDGVGNTVLVASGVATDGSGNVFVTGQWSHNLFRIARAEPGVGGVTFTLTGGNLVSPRVTTSGPDGQFAFVDIPPGTYTVTETVPAGTTPTTGHIAVTVTIGPGEEAVAVAGQAIGPDRVETVDTDLRFGNRAVVVRPG